MSEAECESDMDCSDSDCGDDGYEDYYNNQPWDEHENNSYYDHTSRDPEYADYECLRVDEVDRLLNENVEVLSTNMCISPSLAKLFLHAHEWALQDILQKYQDKSSNLMTDSSLKILQPQESSFTSKFHKTDNCSVCFSSYPTEKFSTLNCGHPFCNDCWCLHFETQVLQGISTGKYILIKLIITCIGINWCRF